MTFSLVISKRDLSQNNAEIYKGAFNSTNFASPQVCRVAIYAFLRAWHKGEGYTEEQLDLDEKVFASFFTSTTGDVLEYRTKDKPNIVYTIVKFGDKAAIEDPSISLTRNAIETTKKVRKVVTTFIKHEQIYSYQTANAEINPNGRNQARDHMLTAFFNSPNFLSISEISQQMNLKREFTIAPANATIDTTFRIDPTYQEKKIVILVERELN